MTATVHPIDAARKAKASLQLQCLLFAQMNEEKAHERATGHRRVPAHEREVVARGCEAMTTRTELIVILPTMTVADIAELCKRHDAYVRIEHTGGKLYAFMEPFREDEHIPVFLRRQAE